MSDIWIGETSLSGTSGPNVVLQGKAYLSNGEIVYWSTTVAFTSNNATTINQAIRDAAVAAATQAGYTVAPGDRKILVGGVAVL